MADMKPRVGKPPLGLLPLAGLEAASGGMEHGAGKYWPGNWKDCKPDEAFTYLHAALRHANAITNGEELDPESGVPHAGLLIAGMMIYCHIRGLGYVEPQVMKDHPERKARLNSLEAMLGPRPPHPPDVKNNADAYHPPAAPTNHLRELEGEWVHEDGGRS